MARNLTAHERRILSARAMELAGLGMTNVAIAERLGVNRKTVPGLLEQAARESDADQPMEAAKAKAHYRQIIRTCWTKLGDKGLSVNSHNLPALISQAAAAQTRLDKLNGIESPIKVDHAHKTLTEHAKEVQGVPREQRLRLVEER